LIKYVIILIVHGRIYLTRSSIMSIRTKMKGLSLIALSALFAAPSAFAEGERLAAGQVDYIGTVIEFAIIAFNGLSFLASVIVLLAGGWFFIKDYVLAKAEHEKKFTPGTLFAAIAVASFLGYQSGAYLLGQDLTVGADNTGGATIKQDDFERKGSD
jgi:hypothetical protein